jgi:PadR family transcriptional regulator AphA
VADTKHSGFTRYPLENVALGLLMAGPKHGYELFQDFVKDFSLIWKAGQTKFYVTLNGLQADNYLQAITEPQTGRPTRKVYHLTPAGEEAFLHWLHQPVKSMRAVRVELIAKMRFFDILELPGAEQLIDAQIDVFQTMLDEWQQRGSVQRAEEANGFYKLVHDYRQQQAGFIIGWLAACKEYFQDKSSKG